MEEDPKKPKRWFRRIAIGVGGMVVILGLSALIWIWVGSYDIDPPDLSDLEIEVVEIEDEANAYTHFIAACEALDASAYSSEMKEWDVHDAYQATEADRALVADNQEAYALLLKAASCDRFIAPRPEWMGDPVLHLKERQLCKPRNEN